MLVAFIMVTACSIFIALHWWNSTRAYNISWPHTLFSSMSNSTDGLSISYTAKVDTGCIIFQYLIPLLLNNIHFMGILCFVYPFDN